MTGRERITYTIKVAAAHVLYYTGLLRIWQSVVLRRKAVVLMYHRVLSPRATRSDRLAPRNHRRREHVCGADGIPEAQVLRAVTGRVRRSTGEKSSVSRARPA